MPFSPPRAPPKSPEKGCAQPPPSPPGSCWQPRQDGPLRSLHKDPLPPSLGVWPLALLETFDCGTCIFGLTVGCRPLTIAGTASPLAFALVGSFYPREFCCTSCVQSMEDRRSSPQSQRQGGKQCTQ
uniref:Uncharacterized protein n=1 Tax=Eutreptiella gymnastica TaxID=73025 RepID=A0A7S1IV28_9EUGL|mmetsp:Transcript_45068/g.80612  ORF Transcript_45068/g.80612 Transcript_45068/m.80612 type:complete len:127 (+) Transcript_45068:714-1094(+)